MLGIDTLCRNDIQNHEILEISQTLNRIILTKDRGLLKKKTVTHGYWIRSLQPDDQAREVLRRFDLLRQLKPFSRCMVCNRLVSSIAKEEIVDRLEPRTIQFYHEFWNCPDCGKIYWKGSQYQIMKEWADELVGWNWANSHSFE